MPGLDPRRADLNVAGSVLLDTILRGLGAERPDAVRSRAARGPRPRLHPPQQRAHPQGRALSRRPPPQRRRARRALRLLVRARAAGGAAGAEHLRSDPQRARTRRSRTRVARIRRAAARRRRAHQLRSPSPALVLPDQEWRSARLRAAGDRGHRARRAIPSPGDAEEVARGLRRSRAARCARRSGCCRPSCGWPKGSIAATRRRSPASISSRAATITSRGCAPTATRSWSCGPRIATSRRSSGSWQCPIRFEVAGAEYKEQPPHAEQPDHAARVPGKAVRGRGNRRVRKDDAARPARKMA